MQTVFSVLGAVASSGYTYTHMVAGDVTDPCERRRCSLFKTASLRAPWSTDKANDNNNPANNDIQCDIHMKARDEAHRSGVLSKVGKQIPITWATCSARRTNKEREAWTLATNDMKATFKQVNLHLRGSGNESQEQRDALEALSEDSCATFKTIVRKLLVIMYNEGTSMSYILDNSSLIDINNEIDDDDVGDAMWHLWRTCNLGK